MIPIDLRDIWEEPLRAECKAFLAAIQTGVPPLTSGAEGLRVVKVLEISQRSITAPSPPLSAIPSTTQPGNSEGEQGGQLAKSFSGAFIHPTAIVDDNVAVGEGAKIWHFSHILSGSKIGEHCNIGQNVVIGPDVAIGARCKIQNNVSVYKGVTLEDGVFCGPSMVFTNICNPRAEISKMDQIRPTLVKRGATLGANCTVVCGHTIGRYAFIGAGAVVTKDVPDHALMAGNPARRIGWVCACGEKLNASSQCPACGNHYPRCLALES